MVALNKLGNERAFVICVAGTKGGIGKTIATANLSGYFADLGLRVLMIDCDKQASLSKHYALTDYANFGLVEFITNGSYEGCISKTNIDGLDLIVNNEFSDEVATFIKQNPSQRLYAMFSLLKHSALSKEYDVILVDTTGVSDVGGKQEMAIRSSDLILSPVEPTWVSSKEVEVTARMVKSLEPLAGMGSIVPVPPICFFFNNVKKTADSGLIIDLISNEDGELYKVLKSHLGDKMQILETQIPSLEIYNQGVLRQEPIHRIHTTRPSQNTLSGLEVMQGLSAEILPETVNLELRELDSNENV